MKRLIKGLTGLCFFLAASVMGAIGYAQNQLPDSFQVTQDQRFSIVFRAPVSVSAKPASKMVQVGSRPVGSKYDVSLNLFGFIPLKNAAVEVVSKSYVVPAGIPFGIKIFTDGVLVVGMTDVDTENGLKNPAKEAGLKEGDVILSMNGTAVNSNDEVASSIEKSSGKPIVLKIRRKNLSFSVTLIPMISRTDSKYKAGMWVRDSSAGIGTMTFYSPNTGVFGGLGHAICDVDTGEILPLMSGEIVAAEIVGITKGKNGVPGELRGRFLDDKNVGSIIHNGETGVYGLLKNSNASEKMVEIAMKQQIREGKAQIYTTIGGTKPDYYDCEIVKVNWNDASPTQNMIIEITDPTLLEQTGGIVQGMSGSPILQNGRLIGAITHVFINNSKKGYAIFAENMQASSQIVLKGQGARAS